MSLGGNSWMILASASNPLTQQPETFVAYVCFRLSIRRWGTLASHELEVASQSHEVNMRSTDNVEALISVTLSYAIGGISVRLSVRHTHTHGGIDSRLNMQFLPHDAMHSADYDIARCLCLSACLPHAGILSKRFYYQTFLLSDRHTILVFLQHQTLWQYFDGDYPNWGAECRGYEKSRFSTNIWLYLRKDTR